MSAKQAGTPACAAPFAASARTCASTGCGSSVGFVALAADVLLRLLEPWPVKLVIDAVTHSLGASIPKPGPRLDASAETLLLCGGAVVAISLVRAVANY